MEFAYNTDHDCVRYLKRNTGHGKCDPLDCQRIPNVRCFGSSVCYCG